MNPATYGQTIRSFKRHGLLLVHMAYEFQGREMTSQDRIRHNRLNCDTAASRNKEPKFGPVYSN